MNNVNQITNILSEVKSSGLFTRLFGWGSIKSKLDTIPYLLDNSSEEERVEDQMKLKAKYYEEQVARYEDTVDHLKTQTLEGTRREIELKTKISNLESELDRSRQLVSFSEENEVKRQAKAMAEEEAKAEEEKRKWKRHEERVQSNIKAICEKHVITYIEKYPVPGQNPDSAIMIGDQIVIFDAKSPQKEDTRQTFAKNYIPRQVSNISKYINKNKAVYPQLFLVVPDDTLESITDTYYNKETYEVFVIPNSALEPVILSIKEIAKYELAEQLDPQDKNNIIRVIGWFSDYTKRRISVDAFMSNKAVEMLRFMNNNIPQELVDGIIEFEKTNITNPPNEKRGAYETIEDVRDKWKSLKIFVE